MPRQARRKSESGIYHVMLRGINQQQIFEDSEDCEKFWQIQLKQTRIMDCIITIQSIISFNHKSIVPY